MLRSRILGEYEADDQTESTNSDSCSPPVAVSRAGTNHDGGLSPARGRPPMGHLPPLSASPSVPTRTAAVAKEWGVAGKSLYPMESTAETRPSAAGKNGGNNVDGQVVTTSLERPGPTRATGPAESTATTASPKKPVSLLKQKTESSIAVGGEKGGGGGGGGGSGPVRVSMIHKNKGRESTISSSRGKASSFYDAATAPRHSMRAANGGSREDAAQRRPQRYDKIKMKTSPAGKNKHAGVIASSSGLTREGTAGSISPGRGGVRPIAIKLKTAGAALGALSVARKVASGFRGDPDWASRASRSAGKRYGQRRRAFLAHDRQHDSNSEGQSAQARSLWPRVQLRVKT